ncbi:hypothetical protein TSMEX_004881 [Taenia solium]|eukprot:TsM_000239900 transcript=TsM_000239900 gene=TsM_000239900
MSSHVRRLQYQQQQQRQAQLQRLYAHGSLSSLGRGYEASLPGVATSHLSGVSGGAVRPSPGSVVSFDQRGYTRQVPGGSMMSFNPPSTLASRSLLGRPSLYAKSSLYRSRSLGASKASLATIQSGRSTIQAEHHDRKVQLLIKAVDFRRATKPYFWSIFFFTLFLFTLFIGLLIICLRHVYMNLILSVDVGECIGPLLCGLSFLFLGAGFKFLYDAYQTGARERQKIKYVPDSASTVAVKVTAAPAVDTTLEIAVCKATASRKLIPQEGIHKRMDQLLEPVKASIFQIKPHSDDPPSPGCYILQYDFDSTVARTLKTISFTNDYTERITGYLFYREPKSQASECVQILRYHLMPHPFRDHSACVDVKIDLPSDFPTVAKAQHLICMRFLLQQSNHMWGNFGIKNAAFYGSAVSSATEEPTGVKPPEAPAADTAPDALNISKLCRRLRKSHDPNRHQSNS